MIFSNKKIIDIEEHWNDQQIFQPKNSFVHTNHSLNKKYWTKPQREDESSMMRYNRAKELVLAQKKFNVNTLKKILRDHKGHICDHFDTKHPMKSAPTIASIIINPYKKWMMLCSGNPCENKYKKYPL